MMYPNFWKEVTANPDYFMQQNIFIENTSYIWYILIMVSPPSFPPRSSSPPHTSNFLPSFSLSLENKQANKQT